MKIDITPYLAAVDDIIRLLEFGATFTPSDADDKIIARIKAFREQVRPLFGSAEGGTEDLPQEIADEIHRIVGSYEFVDTMGS